MWASRVNQGYISLTCHYLTQGFVIKAFTLAHTHLPEGHTTANIQSCFTTTIKKRALDLNAVHVCMVTDNGRNIHAAVHQMEWTQLQCMVHLVQHLDVQLVIKDAREVTPAVSLLCKKA